MEHSPQCAHGLTAATCAVCKHGPTVDAGYNGPPPDVDYTWEARKHETVSRRSNSGRTSQRVTRFGAAYVSGALDIDVHGRPLLAECGPDVNVIDPASAAARMLLAACESVDRHGRPIIRRGRHGLSAIDIARITDAAFTGCDLPPLLNGTEVRQFQQQIHKDRTASAATTTHTTDITGGRMVEISTLWVTDAVDARGVHTPRVVRDDTVADIYEHTAAYGPQTDTEVRWPTRGTADGWKHGRVPYAERNTDPRTRRVFRVSSDGTCERVVIVVNGHTDTETLWDGHTAVDRLPAIVKTTSALADRTTVNTDERPTTAAAWQTLIERLAPGGRAVIGDVSVTYAAGGDRYSATAPDMPRKRSRTAAGLAALLAA